MGGVGGGKKSNIVSTTFSQMVSCPVLVPLFCYALALLALSGFTVLFAAMLGRQMLCRMFLSRPGIANQAHPNATPPQPNPCSLVGCSITLAVPLICLSCQVQNVNALLNMPKSNLKQQPDPV